MYMEKEPRQCVWSLFPFFLRKKNSFLLLHIFMPFYVLFLKHPLVNKFIQRIYSPVSKPVWMDEELQLLSCGGFVGILFCFGFLSCFSLLNVYQE